MIPASYQIQEALQLPGTKVLMKAGKKMAEVKKTLLEQKLPASMIETAAWKMKKFTVPRRRSRRMPDIIL